MSQEEGSTSVPTHKSVSQFNLNFLEDIAERYSNELIALQREKKKVKEHNKEKQSEKNTEKPTNVCGESPNRPSTSFEIVRQGIQLKPKDYETILFTNAYKLLNSAIKECDRLKQELEKTNKTLNEYKSSAKIRKIYSNKVKNSGKKTCTKLNFESHIMNREDLCLHCQQEVQNRKDHICSSHFKVKCSEPICSKKMYIKDMVLHQQKTPCHNNEITLEKMLSRRRKMFNYWFQMCYGRSFEETTTEMQG